MTGLSLPSDPQELQEAMETLSPLSFKINRAAFDGHLRKIAQINALLNVDKYRIVFIGEPGKGKTTAICNWLGLIRNDKKSVNTKEMGCLLTAAAGRTTVSEVHIRQTEGVSSIGISYMSREDQLARIRAFAEQYWEKVREGERNESEVDLSVEMYRLIRNMSGLVDPSQGTSERSKEKNEGIIKMMSDFSTVDEFYNYIVLKIDLDNRMCTDIQYDGSKQFEEWLSSQFHDLNYGLNDDCSIMDKVTINISRVDLDLNLPSYVSEIIDTIGLDSEVREDLQEFMLADDTICFLMDDLTNVPSVLVCNLIKCTFMSDWQRYLSNKVSIFVKSPLLELMAVNEANGDPKRGREIKQANLESICLKKNVPYNPINTLFLDSCAAYEDRTTKEIVLDSNNRPVLDENGYPTYVVKSSIEYNEHMALAYRSLLNGGIDRMIDRSKNRLFQDAIDLKREVEALIQKDTEMRENAVLEIEHLCDSINELLEDFRAEEHNWPVVSTIVNRIFENLHWARMKKLNRIYGGPGSPYGLQWPQDIYSSIRQAGKDIFTVQSKEHIGMLEDILDENENELLSETIKGLKLQISNMVSEATDEIGLEFKEWALKEGFFPLNDSNVFWTRAQSIQGTGYTNNIRNHYSQNINRHADLLRQMVSDKIESIISEIYTSISGTEV